MDSDIYEGTKDACSKVTAKDALGATPAFDRLYAGVFPSAKFNALLTRIRNESFRSAFNELTYVRRSESYKYLISHPQFRKALRECYPRQPEMHAFFERTLYRADRNAKIIAGASEAGLFVTVVGWLGRLVKFNKWLGNSIKAVSIAAPTSVAVYEFYQAKQLKKQVDLCAAETNRSRNDCLRDGLMNTMQGIAETQPTEDQMNESRTQLRELIVSEIQNLDTLIASQSGAKRETLLKLRAEQEAILASIQ